MLRRVFYILLTATAIARAQTMPLLPSGVAYDASGNLYFADTNRHQVFEATLAGALAVVAGSGTQGFAGDGGAATAAQLNSPQSVAVGPDGTLYIADTGNQRIRAVATNGTITTFAGTGSAGYGGDGGAATAAVFDYPNALAIDATGALLVCDSGNHRVRRISAGSGGLVAGVVTAVAGTGVQGFSGDGAAAISAQVDTPSGIAVAADGRIFVADTHNQRVRVIATNGTISTFAGTGVAGYTGDGAAATAARLAMPRGLFATSAGALLIADSNNQRIRLVDVSGTISTIAGDGIQGSSTNGAVATTASLNTPRGIALSSFSAPVFADAGNSMVRELLSNGDLYAPAGMASSRTSTVTLNAVSGATSGQAVVTVTGSAGTPQGTVELYDSGSPVAQATLTAGTASFSLASLAAGAHKLSATYLGDGVNPAATSAAVAVATGQTATVTTMTSPQSSYAGLPLVLTAHVASTTLGTPTGNVLFSEGSTIVATATLSAGAAPGVYLSPAAGSQQIMASYSGDTNFAPSSTTASVTVNAMPDFTLATTSSASQTVLGGAIATYSFTVAANPTPFTGAVSMGVSGLPTGVTAAFSPTQVVPGTGTAQVTLSLQTSANMVRNEGPGMRRIAGWALLLPWLMLARRRRLRELLPVCALALLLISTSGCGDRSLSAAASQASKSYGITVTGTATNLAGAVIVHSLPITLVVQ